MRASVFTRLAACFDRIDDLVSALPADALARRLPVPSNAIAGQLWCIAGARESYARAIDAGSWQGFSCALTADELGDPTLLRACLRRAADAAAALQAEVAHWDAPRDGLLLALLEHESQHQGQLIRYVYGLDLGFPESWKERWALVSSRS
jgi:hypothetical protein